MRIVRLRIVYELYTRIYVLLLRIRVYNTRIPARPGAPRLPTYCLRIIYTRIYVLHTRIYVLYKRIYVLLLRMCVYNRRNMCAICTYALCISFA